MLAAMAGRARSKRRSQVFTPATGAPTTTGTPAPPPPRRGRRWLLGGAALVIAGLACTLVTGGALRYALVYGAIIAGAAAIVTGAVALTPAASPAPPRPDARRWIYGGLDLAFAIAYAVAIWKLVPTRLPSAALHLWTLPLCALAMGAGALRGGRTGWWISIVAGSAMLLSIVLLIARILISAAFLAGVYGAFGKTAASFAFVAVALIVEIVALLPLVQIKFLMTRAGRRAHGL